MNKQWFEYVGWIAAAVVMGYLIPAVLSGGFHLKREIFLIPYVVLTVAFLAAFVRWSGLNLVDLIRKNWIFGLIGAVVVGIFLVRNILSQPASGTAVGFNLVFQIAWEGVVYGMVDALLLSVFPIMAVTALVKTFGIQSNWQAVVLTGVLSLVVSLVITVAYHLGYPEYQGAQVAAPALGNSVMTLGTILSGNPITALFSHISMHVAGVLHGPATVVQLPPHF
jgi:hypothetical protein